MYRKCMGKQKDNTSFKHYILYRNKCNELEEYVNKIIMPMN